MENVQDKTAIITGGYRSIGYNIAKELLHNGAKKIAIIDLPTLKDKDAVTTLQEKFGKERVIYFSCDVTKSEDYKETFKEIVRVFNGLDILVNNAGIHNDNLVEQTFNVNVLALIHGSFMALDHMGKHKGGKGGTILNIASIAGLEPAPELIVYSVSKVAVVAFGGCLKTFYNKTNVRVLTLCPGLTQSPLTSFKHSNFLDIVNEEHLHNIFDDITQTCTYVASTAVKLIQEGKNGTIFVVRDNLPGFAVDIPTYVRK